jgi:hypothetical protein
MMDIADGLVVGALTLGVLVHERRKRSRSRNDRLEKLEREVQALRDKLDAVRHLAERDVTTSISEFRTVSISFVEETLTVENCTGQGESWDTEYRIHRVGAEDDMVEDTLGPGRWFIKSMRSSSYDPAKGMYATGTGSPSGERWVEAEDDLALFAEGAFRQWREMRRELRGDPLVVPRGHLDDEVMREGSRIA